MMATNRHAILEARTMITIRTHVGIISDLQVEHALKSSIITKKVGKNFDGGWFWIESSEEMLLGAILDVANECGGLSFGIKIDCSKRLQANAPYFQIIPKLKLKLTENEEDKIESSFTRKAIGNNKSIMALDPNAIMISFRCQTNQLYNLLDGYNEIATHPETAERMISMTRSIATETISKEPNGSCSLLLSKGYAPELVLDDSISFLDSSSHSKGWPVQAGLLCLKNPIETPGMYRLQDSLNATQSPDWIITSDLLDEMDKAGIPISRHYPMMDAGSDLHQQYLEVWSPYIARIRKNSGNSIQIW